MTFREWAKTGAAVLVFLTGQAEANPGDPLVDVPLTLTFASHSYSAFGGSATDTYNATFSNFAFDPAVHGGILIRLGAQTLTSTGGGYISFGCNISRTSLGCVGNLHSNSFGTAADAAHFLTGTGLGAINSYNDRDVDNSGPIIGFSSSVQTAAAGSNFTLTGMHLENTTLTQPATTYGNVCNVCSIYIVRSSLMSDPGRFTTLGVQAIPTLNEWGMIVMAVLFSGAGLYLVRRRMNSMRAGPA